MKLIWTNMLSIVYDDKERESFPSVSLHPDESKQAARTKLTGKKLWQLLVNQYTPDCSANLYLRRDTNMNYVRLYSSIIYFRSARPFTPLTFSSSPVDKEHALTSNALALMSQTPIYSKFLYLHIQNGWFIPNIRKFSVLNFITNCTVDSLTWDLPRGFGYK